MEIPIGFLFFVIGYLLMSIKVVKEYERRVVFTLGKADGVKGPGLQLIFPIFQTDKKVDLRIITMAIPMQEIITKDNVSVKTAAVCFFQLIDPYKAVTKIEDPFTATSQVAQTTLRSILGQHELDELLTERDAINAKLSVIIDRQTESWGIKVNSVEVKDVEIPEGMQRAMARQAEAERERRAKIVAAEGEHQAAEKLGAAARLLGAEPGAMQLRQLQTMVEVSAEKNSTLIFPIPMEIMEFVTTATAGAREALAVQQRAAAREKAAEDSTDAPKEIARAKAGEEARSTGGDTAKSATSGDSKNESNGATLKLSEKVE